MGGTYVQRLFFWGKGGFDALQNPLSSTPLAVAWLRQHAVMLKIGEHKLSVNCSTFYGLQHLSAWHIVMVLGLLRS